MTEVHSVTEVAPWSEDDVDEASPMLERRDFTWSSSGMLRRRGGVWRREFRSLTVDLEHGFDEEHGLDFLTAVVKAAARAATVAGGEVTRVGDIAYQATGAGMAGGATFLGSEYAVLDSYRLNPEV